VILRPVPVQQLITNGPDWRGYLRFGPGRTLLMAKDLSSTKERKKLSKKSFALPGKRKYPIPDKAHARNALARVAQHGTPAEQKKVEAAVRKRYPSLGKNSKKSQKRSTKGSKQNT